MEHDIKKAEDCPKLPGCYFRASKSAFNPKSCDIHLLFSGHEPFFQGLD